MKRTVPLAAIAVVIAAFLGARLHDHDRCEDAREAVFAAALRGEGAPAGAVERIRETCRGAAALVGASNALHTRGRDAEAAALAREATEQEPENAQAWRALAEATRDPGEARTAARRATELDPLGAPLNRPVVRPRG